MCIADFQSLELVWLSGPESPHPETNVFCTDVANPGTLAMLWRKDIGRLVDVASMQMTLRHTCECSISIIKHCIPLMLHGYLLCATIMEGGSGEWKCYSTGVFWTPPATTMKSLPENTIKVGAISRH
jgi:hypothetical protein